MSQLLTQVQDLLNQVNSLSDAREFYDTETASGSGANHVPSQPSTIPSPRTMPCRDSGLPHTTPAHHTEHHGYIRKRFWTATCSRRTTLCILQQFKEFGILFSRIGTRYWRKYKEAGEWNETRTATFVDTFATLPKWRWIVESYWWNLFSQWCDWLSEVSEFGNPSGKISSPYGIPKLESQLSRLKCVLNQQILISQCNGSKKLR